MLGTLKSVFSPSLRSGSVQVQDRTPSHLRRGAGSPTPPFCSILVGEHLPLYCPSASGCRTSGAEAVRRHICRRLRGQAEAQKTVDVQVVMQRRILHSVLRCRMTETGANDPEGDWTVGRNPKNTDLS